MRQCGRLS